MFYRIRQFNKALFPYVTIDEIQWLKQVLPAPALYLFLNQSKPEQRHALDVALSLKKYTNLLSIEDNKTLIAAALLHDCGKSVVKVRLWHRIFIVILQNFSAKIWAKLQNNDSPFSLPLRLASCHAEWGAKLAAEAGLDEQICQLISQHHHPQTILGQLLKFADDKN